jgi:hypothetical protein
LRNIKLRFEFIYFYHEKKNSVKKSVFIPLEAFLQGIAACKIEWKSLLPIISQFIQNISFQPQLIDFLLKAFVGAEMGEKLNNAEINL